MKRTIRLTGIDQRNHAFDTIRKAMAEGRLHVVDIKPETKQRTGQQNNALHLYCGWLADWLNNNGYYQVINIKGLKKEIEREWDYLAVKDHLLRPFVKAEAGHDKTSKATTDELSNAIEKLQDGLAVAMGVNIPFPSRFNLMNEVTNG